VLVVAAIIALAWANLFPASYAQIFTTPISLTVGPFHFEETLRFLINDGLMVLFFFVVGLEIKREMVSGELADPRKAALPAIAALGGMLAPALIFLAIVGGGTEASRGWGVPMATDIAFAVGVLALFGRRVPEGAKLFLLTLAVADDIGAIAVIAIFYTSRVELDWLLMAVGLLIVVWLANRAGVRSMAFYIPAGLVVWFATLESGIHATLAGVALGLLTPARPFYSLREFDRSSHVLLQSLRVEGPVEREFADHELLTLSAVARESVAPLARIEQRLGLWASYLIVPVFALANAGIHFGEIRLGEALLSRVGLGVGLGLLVGKTAGITLFTLLFVRSGWGRLPRGMNMGHVAAVSVLAAIGFTVALLVVSLAFTTPVLADSAKVGIFAASLLAALLGYPVLRLATRRRPEE
jgi:NhaA family Na+:H+ antiporter